jgi:hypothetical protein
MGSFVAEGLAYFDSEAALVVWERRPFANGVPTKFAEQTFDDVIAENFVVSSPSTSLF